MQNTTEYSTGQVENSPDQVVLNINDDDDMCNLERNEFEKEDQDYEINMIKSTQQVEY